MASINKWYSFFKPEFQAIDTGAILSNLDQLLTDLDHYQDVPKEDKDRVRALVFEFIDKKHPGTQAMRDELNNCVVRMFAINNKSINSLVRTFVEHYQQEMEKVNGKIGLGLK